MMKWSVVAKVMRLDSALLTCDSPIGSAHFGIETEAQERMLTGNGIYDRTDHHVVR